MAVPALADRLRERIRAAGSMPVDAFVAAALYDPDDGFYSVSGRAGRRGDFLTAPEVGPLFGAVVSHAVDTWWTVAGRPERFVVAEHGAGPGTLARTVTAAAGECLAADALRWVMVEPSGPQRLRHPEGHHLVSVASSANVGSRVDVVFANELLDNLPFGIATRTDTGWRELRVVLDREAFVLGLGDPVDDPAATAEAPAGSVVPLAADAVEWVRAQRAAHPGARLVVLDYAAPTTELVGRAGEWVRGYRDHDRVEDWMAEPGSCDITIDLPLEQIAATEPTRVDTQAQFLRDHGLDELVAEGRRAWEAGAHVGDLAALRGRSRITEAEGLLDPVGMGAFTVWQWDPVGS